MPEKVKVEAFDLWFFDAGYPGIEFVVLQVDREDEVAFCVDDNEYRFQKIPLESFEDFEKIDSNVDLGEYLPERGTMGLLEVPP